jgi:hypothetical protein
VVTQNIGDLGKLRGETLRKARHPCGNPPHGETDFYPELAEVGKEFLKDMRSLIVLSMFGGVNSSNLKHDEGEVPPLRTMEVQWSSPEAAAYQKLLDLVDRL